MSFATDVYADNQKRLQAGSSTGTANQPALATRFDAHAVTNNLRDRIIAQDGAIDAVDRVLRTVQMGLQDPERPLASLLLVGPTGVGKTELVRRLAAEIRGGADDFCRVDMGSLAQEHYAASFAGAPPGYAGSKEGFSVFDRDLVEGDAYRPGIVLFDEVEKASPVVLRALLQVLDRGLLRLSNGQQTISFRNSLVFLTSNLGSRELADRQHLRERRQTGTLRRGRAGTSRSRAAGSAPSIDEAIVSTAVEKFFDPEFLNRIDEMVFFREISGQSAVDIAALELRLLQQRLQRELVSLHVTDNVAQKICELGYDPAYGARSLRRVIQRFVLPEVADALRHYRREARQPISIRLMFQSEAFVAVVEPDNAPRTA